MNLKTKFILVILSVTFFSKISFAETGPWTLSFGNFDFSDKGKNASLVEVDYGFKDKLFSSPIGDVKPVAGFFATEKSSVYGFTGVKIDYQLFDNLLTITPSFTPGLYHKGDGKDLGHTVEFKSQVRAGLNFSKDSFIGAAYNHLSNASLGSKNPGANSYTINLQTRF
ncbi:MAG: acyloxyacyl hydrolase [Candidatus Fonsibacter sp.]